MERVDVYEFAFNRAAGESDSAADIPKAPGDNCTLPGCAGVLEIEFEQSESQFEPSISPIVFCPICGYDYVPDWTRIET